MSLPISAAPQALPTLLTSRQQMPSSGKSAAKVGREICPSKKLPKAYAMPVCIRNTFIDTAAERSPSMERFYKEREVSTCPSAHIGRLRNLFQEVDADAKGNGDDLDTRLPSEAPDTRSVSEASPCNAAIWGNGVMGAPVLSLAEALEPPFQACSQVGSLLGGRASVVMMPAHSIFPDESGRDPRGASASTCDGAGAAAAGAWFPRVAGFEPQVEPSPPDHPALGSDEMPTVGSAGHAAGSCKPCAFFHTVGCSNGLACSFCHLCDADERKRRRKTKLEARRAEKLREASTSGALAK